MNVRPLSAYLIGFVTTQTQGRTIPFEAQDTYLTVWFVTREAFVVGKRFVFDRAFEIIGWMALETVTLFGKSLALLDLTPTVRCGRQ